MSARLAAVRASKWIGPEQMGRDTGQFYSNLPPCEAERELLRECLVLGADLLGCDVQLGSRALHAVLVDWLVQDQTRRFAVQIARNEDGISLPRGTLSPGQQGGTTRPVILVRMDPFAEEAQGIEVTPSKLGEGGEGRSSWKRVRIMLGAVAQEAENGGIGCGLTDKGD